MVLPIGRFMCDLHAGQIHGRYERVAGLIFPDLSGVGISKCDRGVWGENPPTSEAQFLITAIGYNSDIREGSVPEMVRTLLGRNGWMIDQKK